MITQSGAKTQGQSIGCPRHRQSVNRLPRTHLRTPFFVRHLWFYFLHSSFRCTTTLLCCRVHSDSSHVVRQCEDGQEREVRRQQAQGQGRPETKGTEAEQLPGNGASPARRYRCVCRHRDTVHPTTFCVLRACRRQFAQAVQRLRPEWTGRVQGLLASQPVRSAPRPSDFVRQRWREYAG